MSSHGTDSKGKDVRGGKNKSRRNEMKKFIGFAVVAFWVVGGLLLTPGISCAQQLVPEPVSLLFLGAGLVGLAAVGRIIKK
jgi:hypothetical protein